VCVARRPLLDLYFGQEKVDLGRRGSADEARVLVQPDFSIVIVGLNPAPAGELAPFCERVRGHAGQGALELKITREAVIKAVMHGLQAADIVDRLQRHASKGVPANVLREVQEWCGWVRRVSPETVVLLRCPDPDTADRVASVLGRRVERLTETVVVVPGDPLTGAERTKLQKQGVIVATGGTRRGR
jgi:hypothetical protein